MADCIVIRPDLWGKRLRVALRPPRMDMPGQSFPDRAEAIKHADALRRQTGLEVVDETESANGE